MKKLTTKQEGTLFLFILSSAVWFFIGISNNKEILGSLLSGIILGAITTLALVILFALMKAIFNW